MKTSIRFLSSIVLGLLFVVACLLGMVVIFFAAWLHTYQVFTARTLVAEVQVSKIQRDGEGEFMDVIYTPFSQQSALVSLFVAEGAKDPAAGAPQQFKVYGDSVHVGGPMVKFYDNLILLNFKTIYKVGTLFGRYNFDPNKENSRDTKSTFELNGGIDPTWQDVRDRTSAWPYSMFVESVQLSSPAIIGSKTASTTYNMFVTTTGFLFVQK